MPSGRDPFVKLSGPSAGSPLILCARAHLLRASTVSIEHALPTLPIESVVTPHPPANVTGLLAHRRADDSVISSTRNSPEPVSPVDVRSTGA